MLWVCSSTSLFGVNDLVEQSHLQLCCLLVQCGSESPFHLFTLDITLDIGNNHTNSPSVQIKFPDKFQRKYGTCIHYPAHLLPVFYHSEHALLSSSSYFLPFTKTNSTTFLGFCSWSSSFWWFHAVR